jgi:hypothetical protein
MFTDSRDFFADLDAFTDSRDFFADDATESATAFARVKKRRRRGIDGKGARGTKKTGRGFRTPRLSEAQKRANKLARAGKKAFKIGKAMESDRGGGDVPF